jgi:hypothetical protein
LANVIASRAQKTVAIAVRALMIVPASLAQKIAAQAHRVLMTSHAVPPQLAT